MYQSKKRRCTTVISHININNSNTFNASKFDNIIGTLNLPHSNGQDGSPFITIISLQKVTDTESNISVNDEINNKNI